MKAISAFPRILIFRGKVDFRKRKRGLAAFVQDLLAEDPFSKTLFVFFNRKKDCVRALYWDRTGFAMWEKELEEAKFPWPKKISETTTIALLPQQVEWLLEGVDIWKLNPHEDSNFSRVF
jgi:transposase